MDRVVIDSTYLKFKSDRRNPQSSYTHEQSGEVWDNLPMNDGVKTTKKFPGFTSPNTTPVPDQFFDEVLDGLSGAETKVALYIIRRTFGFKKERDHISLSQMVNGIKKRDGAILDKGTGLAKSTVSGALTTLEQKGIIIRTRRQSVERGDEPTTYALNIIGHNGSSDGDFDRPGDDGGGSGGNDIDPTPPVFDYRTPRVSKSNRPVSQNRTHNKHLYNKQDDRTVNRSENPVKSLPLLELDEGEVQDIANYIGQKLGTGDSHSRNFHLALAWRIPKRIIEHHLNDIVETGAKSPGALFTHRMKEVAREKLAKDRLQEVKAAQDVSVQNLVQKMTIGQGREET